MDGLAQLKQKAGRLMVEAQAMQELARRSGDPDLIAEAAKVAQDAAKAAEDLHALESPAARALVGKRRGRRRVH